MLVQGIYNVLNRCNTVDLQTILPECSRRIASCPHYLHRILLTMQKNVAFRPASLHGKHERPPESKIAVAPILAPYMPVSRTVDDEDG